jgi:hypothetical protein
MVLDFLQQDFNTKIPALDELIEEGVGIKAFGSHGWTHQGQVFLSHNHGVPAYQEEFRSLDGMKAKQLVTFGLNKIVSTLINGRPVIVSVEKGFIESGKFHQVVLVGYEDNDGGVFFYHEPEAPDDSGAYKKVTREVFLRYWRHLAIFIG